MASIFVYVVFFILVLYGGFMVFIGNEVIVALREVLVSSFPDSWTGVDLVALNFVSSWWLWLRLFVLIGGIWWMIIQSQRERERRF